MQSNNRRVPGWCLAVVAALSALALTACGPVEEDVSAEDDGLGRTELPIVGGVTAPSYTSVFWLIDFQAGSSCTSTLIGTRTLLTAAHCADNPNGNYLVTNEQDYDNAFDSGGQPRADKFIKVTKKSIRAGWPNSQKYDIAMMLLEKAPTNTTPKSWNTAAVDTFDDGLKPLRAVGYGKTSGSDTQNSNRRQVDLRFEYVDADYIFLGNGSSKGICQGDSGGPSFHTFTDGVERVVGVHSFTLQPGDWTECTWGADVRVDAHRTFVSSWMSQNEVAKCEADGLCKEGCSPVDIDCECRTDGVCSSTCSRPELDSDCPANCGADGVCATETCGRPDADCKSIGQACTSIVQCQYRRCVPDENYTSDYCSQNCTNDTDCKNSSMSCQGGACKFMTLPDVGIGEACVKNETKCNFGSDCVDLEGDGTGTCQMPCNDSVVCAENAVCRETLPGQFHCFDTSPLILPPKSLPRASAVYTAPPEGLSALSCAAIPVGSSAPAAFALLALLGLSRRRSR